MNDLETILFTAIQDVHYFKDRLDKAIQQSDYVAVAEAAESLRDAANRLSLDAWSWTGATDEQG